MPPRNFSRHRATSFPLLTSSRWDTSGLSSLSLSCIVSHHFGRHPRCDVRVDHSHLLCLHHLLSLVRLVSVRMRRHDTCASPYLILRGRGMLAVSRWKLNANTKTQRTQTLWKLISIMRAREAFLCRTNALKPFYFLSYLTTKGKTKIICMPTGRTSQPSHWPKRKEIPGKKYLTTQSIPILMLTIQTWMRMSLYAQRTHL